MKFIISLLVLLLYGCAEIKIQGESNPVISKLTGTRVAIRITDKDYKPIPNSLLSQEIYHETLKWLTLKGYTIVNEAKKADLIIALLPTQQSREVHVPGQTYSIPVYNTNSTTSVITDANGMNLGTVQTSSTNPLVPSGYVTNYREGYDTTVRDRWLYMTIYANSFNKFSVTAYQGVAYPEKYNQKFYDDKSVLAEAISKLLSDSPLGKLPVEGIVNSPEEPGCMVRVGFLWDYNKRAPEGIPLTGFMLGSYANSAGFQIGDMIQTIDGVQMPTNIQIEKGAVVKVKASRDGKVFEKEVRTFVSCIMM